MSRVCISVQTGASIYVFADEHCPPHVHARHRGEGWVARIRFSFVSNKVQLMSVTPLRNIPLPRIISQLLDDAQDVVPACRNVWWAMRGTVCLDNQWASALSQSMALHPERRPGSMQVCDARYDQAGNQLFVRFKNGTDLTMEAGSGADL